MKTEILIFTATILLTNTIALGKQEGRAMSDKERWNSKYEGTTYIYGKEPTAFLKDKLSLLKKGKAVVLAMGEGRNAVYLAENGFDVTGVDISEVGIEKCERLAEERGVLVNSIVADLADYDMGTEQYDLITNFYFYDKSILPKVIDSLKPGGIFIFETYSRDHPKFSKFGPKNPDYLVKPNELLEIFKSLRILYYEDTVTELDEGMHKGKAALIRLIAKKLESE